MLTTFLMRSFEIYHYWIFALLLHLTPCVGVNKAMFNWGIFSKPLYYTIAIHFSNKTSFKYKPLFFHHHVASTLHSKLRPHIILPRWHINDQC
jgi:hypothetical protein